MYSFAGFRNGALIEGREHTRHEDPLSQLRCQDGCQHGPDFVGNFDRGMGKDGRQGAGQERDGDEEDDVTVEDLHGQGAVPEGPARHHLVPDQEAETGQVEAVVAGGVRGVDVAVEEHKEADLGLCGDVEGEEGEDADLRGDGGVVVGRGERRRGEAGGRRGAGVETRETRVDEVHEGIAVGIEPFRKGGRAQSGALFRPESHCRRNQEFERLSWRSHWQNRGRRLAYFIVLDGGDRAIGTG